jgi:hypothetical protein
MTNEMIEPIGEKYYPHLTKIESVDLLMYDREGFKKE